MSAPPTTSDIAIDYPDYVPKAEPPRRTRMELLRDYSVASVDGDTLEKDVCAVFVRAFGHARDAMLLPAYVADHRRLLTILQSFNTQADAFELGYIAPLYDIELEETFLDAARISMMFIINETRDVLEDPTRPVDVLEANWRGYASLVDAERRRIILLSIAAFGADALDQQAHEKDFEALPRQAFLGEVFGGTEEADAARAEAIAGVRRSGASMIAAQWAGWSAKCRTLLRVEGDAQTYFS